MYLETKILREYAEPILKMTDAELEVHPDHMAVYGIVRTAKERREEAEYWLSVVQRVELESKIERDFQIGAI